MNDSTSTLQPDVMQANGGAPNGTPAFEFRNLHRFFGRLKAVNNVSFKAWPGQVVGFIGPNGAGKTTTLKMLSGILHPTGGSARVLGHIPWQRKREFLRQIAMVRGSRPIGGPGKWRPGNTPGNAGASRAS